MDSSQPNDCVFLQITSSFPDLFKNVNKNLSYLNHLLNIQINGMFYLEAIQNGIIYVYKDLDLFLMLNSRMSSKAIIELKEMDRKGSALFLEDILTLANFPADGLILHFQIFANTEKDLVSVLIKYFTSYKEPNIELVQLNAMELDLIFKSYYALTLYTQRLGRLFEKVMEKGKIPLTDETPKILPNP